MSTHEGYFFTSRRCRLVTFAYPSKKIKYKRSWSYPDVRFGKPLIQVEMPHLNPSYDDSGSGSGDQECDDLVAETVNTTTTVASVKLMCNCATSSTSSTNVAPSAPSTPAWLPNAGHLNPSYDDSGSGSGDQECDDLVAETPNTTTTVASIKLMCNCETSSTSAPSTTKVGPPAPSTPAWLPNAGLPSSDDVFYLQYLGSKLSKYSPHTKNTVQYLINRIIYKADMDFFELTETDPKKDDSD